MCDIKKILRFDWSCSLLIRSFFHFQTDKFFDFLFFNFFPFFSRVSLYHHVLVLEIERAYAFLFRGICFILLSKKVSVKMFNMSFDKVHCLFVMLIQVVYII